jgi:hypothetical protein
MAKKASTRAPRSAKKAPVKKSPTVKKSPRVKKSSAVKKSPAPPAGPRLVGIAAVAARLRVTPRRVQQLVGDGLPRVTRGKYDIDAVLDWFILRLEAQLAGDTDPSTKADLAEIVLAQQRRELVSIADVEKAMTDLVVTTKARLMAVPARLAPDLVGETSRVMIQAKIEKAQKEALQHLASTTPTLAGDPAPC